MFNSIIYTLILANSRSHICYDIIIANHIIASDQFLYGIRGNMLDSGHVAIQKLVHSTTVVELTSLTM